MTPRSRHPLTLIAAVARNGVIGAGGALPWHLPGDLARFRALTWGHPLLMGRKTFAAIGRPLPGRATTVMSRTPGFAPAGAIVAPDLATALAGADRQADALGADTIMVAGGGAVYAATIEIATRLLVTEVAAEPAGDATFPPIDPRVWVLAEAEVASRRPGDAWATRFVRWERRAAT